MIVSEGEETQNMGEIRNQNKIFLIRVVNAREINLYILDLNAKRQLKIYEANRYKLLLKMIDFVKQNGKKGVIKTFYRPKNMVYKDDLWELRLTGNFQSLLGCFSLCYH